jgi:hypothetical protein
MHVTAEVITGSWWDYHKGGWGAHFTTTCIHESAKWYHISWKVYMLIHNRVRNGLFILCNLRIVPRGQHIHKFFQCQVYLLLLNSRPSNELDWAKEIYSQAPCKEWLYYSPKWTLHFRRRLIRVIYVEMRVFLVLCFLSPDNRLRNEMQILWPMRSGHHDYVLWCP